MGKDLLTEKQFLINLAISRFNEQYGRDIDPTTINIKSISPNYGSDLGYELQTLRKTDYLRLRMYLSFSRVDGVMPYRLEVDKTFIPDALGDEIFVTKGSVNRYYQDAGIYKFRWIAPDVSTVDYFETYEHGYFELMGTGEKLELFSA